MYEARLRHGIELFEAGVAPILVVTGGRQPGDRTTEAAVGRAYALNAGVPDASILVEAESRNTLESLQAVTAMLEATGSTTVVLVSDRSHMLRSMKISTDLGLSPRSSPATDSPADANTSSRLDATVHELAALAFYFLGLGA